MYWHNTRYRPRPKRSWRKIFFLALFALLVITVVRRPEPAVLSPVPEDTGENRSIIRYLFPPHKKDPEDLQRDVQNIVDNAWPNYSVLVKDMASDFSMGINENIIYMAASVNKIPILTSLYYLAQKEDVDLDEMITLQPADIQDYGTGSIRYSAPGTTYSIKTLAKLMIQQSDNTAAYILANHVVGISIMQSLMNDWGLTQTDIVSNKTSNRDMAILLEKLYKGGITGTALTQEALAFLKDTDFENRLPALLPKGATVYHKIGTEVRIIHDVGIVKDGDTAYYIGVLTADVLDEEGAEALIA
ncbi:class A beta-lactamase-related serine hydrolase, partial [Patescibacteria group bacterium]|nr:class A beta-lactamase-related serine hydrolase [Patescibacteria group bacterium]